MIFLTFKAMIPLSYVSTKWMANFSFLFIHIDKEELHLFLEFPTDRVEWSKFLYYILVCRIFSLSDLKVKLQLGIYNF